MAEVLRWAAVAGGGFLLLTGSLLGARRLAGALSQPLGLPALVMVAVVLIAAAVAVRLGLRFFESSPTALVRGAAVAVVSAAVLLVGGALCVPGTSPTGALLLWLAVVLEETWAWRPWRWMSVRTRPISLTADTASSEARIEEPLEACSVEPADRPFGPEDLLGEEVTQQLTRSRAADGSETFIGWLRVAFAAGQRSASVHVAFCPPFARTPRVTIEQLDGPETRIKVVQALPYGARCDLKLTGACEAPEVVLLRLFAQAVAPATNKAGG